MHWNIDYLREAAVSVEALPIRSSKRIECDVAGALAEMLLPGPHGFGASDCRCATHLFHSQEDPQNLARFHDVLESFRMRPPDTGS